MVKTTAGAVETGASSHTKSAGEHDESYTSAGALHGGRRRAADPRLDREDQVNERRFELCHLRSSNKDARVKASRDSAFSGKPACALGFRLCG